MTFVHDWRYTDDRLEVRARALQILLSRYGGAIESNGTPSVDPEKIYGCAHDWVSQGNVRTDGIVAFFKAYYL